MRRIFATFLTGALLPVMTVSTSHAQTLNSTVQLCRQPSILKFISSFNGIDREGFAGTVRLNELNARAVRNFSREYKDVPDPKWFKSDNGFIACFISDGKKTWEFYAKKGENLGSVSYYSEEKLPPHIRHRVKSTYYDFNIYQVSEVDWNNKLVYVISMEDNRSKDEIFYKIVRIVDEGEMELIKEYSEKINYKDSASHTSKNL